MKIFLNILYKMIFITTLLIHSAAANETGNQMKKNKNNSILIEEIIDHKLKVQKNAVGISVALVNNNQVEFLNFGLVNGTKKIKTTSSHLFEIGSISKTFTATALAHMVQEGKVKLDDPVQKYLPKNVKLPTRNGKLITLENLSNHTSSLPRLPTNMPFGNPQDPYADYTVELMYEFVNGYELTREIGSKVEYSNLAVGLLGHVLGLIDGKTYEQVITNRVLKPLKMNETFVNVPETHTRQLSDGHSNTLSKVSYWQLPTLAGAGAIKSNVKDMALYLQAHLNEKPLTKTVKLTHQQTTQSAQHGASVGLGWFKTDYSGGSYLWHNGGTGGFRSFMGFDKENNKGIVILENTVNGVDAIGNAYLTGGLAQLKSDLMDTVQVEAKKLARLNGRYELVPGFIMEITNNEQQLYVQATGQPKLPLMAKSELVFVNADAQAKITFKINKKGESIALVLDQGGQSREAAKLSGDTDTSKSPKLSLTNAQLDNLLGIYQLTPNFAITTTHENGNLYIQATGQQKIMMETNSKSEFFNALVQAKIVFELDDKGKAISLTLFQAGQELKGEKK